MKENEESQTSVYTKENSLSESEFFKRELDMRLTKEWEPAENRTSFIAGTNPFEYDKILMDNPAKSIVFFLLGNESYDVEKYKFFNELKSIKKVFLYNPPRKNSLIGLKSVLGASYDSPSIWAQGKFYRTWKNAYDFAKRSRSMELSYEYSSFPQGYSNRFVQELQSLKLATSSGSLFEALNRSTPIPSKGVGFVGQKGSWWRQQLLESFSSEADFTHFQTFGWAGQDSEYSTRYIESILSNRTTLHLPGNITNQSHRYAECLLLWRLPAAPRYTLQDHHYTNYWSEESHFGRNLSYKKLVKAIMNMSDQEYESNVKIARDKLFREIQNVKSQIRKLSMLKE